jgi:endonuclease YncB( thermonuclease family)
LTRAREQLLELELNQKLLRRRLWGLRIAIALVVIGAGVVVADHLGWFGYRGNDWARFGGKEFVVSHVIDGQTLMLQLDWSQQERVRLLGVYAPQPTSIDGGDPEHFGTECVRYATARAAGQKVIVQLDAVGTRDDRGALLAFVYLSDSEMLNLSMIRSGMAYADRRVKHSLSRQFEQAENEARNRRSGLWKELTDDRMPPWRQQWLQSLKRGQ